MEIHCVHRTSGGNHLFLTEHISGIWIDSNLDVMYALATRITFICPMRFNAFPMDIQVKDSISIKYILLH